MTDDKRPLKVFICYASQDKPRARELYHYLKRRKVNPWLDEMNLLPGQDWDLEIYKATRDADVIIICISKESVAKEGYVQKEIRHALDISEEKPDGTIFVIPLRLEECEVPIRLKKYHWVDLFNEGGYPKLMKSLKVRASQLERATVQVSKQDEKSPYLAEKPKQESHDGVSINVNGNVLGNIIIGNENSVQSQTFQPVPEKQIEPKPPVVIEKKESEKPVLPLVKKKEVHLINHEERRKELLELEEKAIQYTKSGDKRRALQIYQEIQGTDILNYVPNVGIKIRALELELNSFEGEPEKEKGEKKPNHKLKTEYIIAIIGAAATILAALIGILPQIIKLAPVPTPPAITAILTTSPTPVLPSATTIGRTQTPTATFTVLPPSKTLEPSLTNTETFTLTPTPLPSQITDAKGVQMVFVSVGKFTMGSNQNSNEKPIHSVYLDAFHIDKFEVTNRLYQACVVKGVCDPPKGKNTSTRPNYYGNPEFDDYPVVNVDWKMANTYCSQWRDARLPTEAEWEKAARGTDERTYPWGEGIDTAHANYNKNIGDATKVNDYESGKSPYGVYNMAGNVYEWVADSYSETYYKNSPTSNPLGPALTMFRVARGGDWGGDENSLHVSARGGFLPYEFNYILGFRCARSYP